MTENEAIKILVGDIMPLNIHYSPFIHKGNKAHEIAIQALKEIQEYRAIGTVEELKALKEKNEPTKVIEHETPYFVHWQCGNCGAEFYSGQIFCDDCGHPADWGELLK